MRDRIRKKLSNALVLRREKGPGVYGRSSSLLCMDQAGKGSVATDLARTCHGPEGKSLIKPIREYTWQVCQDISSDVPAVSYNPQISAG